MFQREHARRPVDQIRCTKLVEQLEPRRLFASSVEIVWAPSSIKEGDSAIIEYTVSFSPEPTQQVATVPITFGGTATDSTDNPPYPDHSGIDSVRYFTCPANTAGTYHENLSLTAYDDEFDDSGETIELTIGDETRVITISEPVYLETSTSAAAADGGTLLDAVGLTSGSSSEDEEEPIVA